MVSFRPRFRSAAVAAVTALLLATGSAVAYADSISADADSLASATPHGNNLTVDQAVGTTVSYPFSAIINNTGNATNDVFTGTVNVSITSGGDWLASSAGSTLIFTAYDTDQPGTISIAVPCTAAGTTKTMTVDLVAGTSSNSKDLNPNSVSLTYVITGTGSCTSANHAPTIAADHASVTGPEGSVVTNTGTWSDADTTDTVTLTASYGAVTKAGTNASGTWSWSATPADGPNDSQTVTIYANDGNVPTNSIYTTFGLTVNNVVPTVTSSISGSIDCQTNATLSLSFSDPGINDGGILGDGWWAVDINWGDGTAHTQFEANAQGNVVDPSHLSHLYTTPGNYTAGVTVTDKDGGVGTDSGADNQITVLQTYATTFLAPFDGSSPSNLITNTMKNGRVVPVKVKIFDECTLSYVTDPTAIVTIGVKHATTDNGSSTDSLETYADAGQSSAGTNQFRLADGFWIYNLDSKELALVTNNVYRIDAYVNGVQATQDTWALLKPVK